MRFAVITALLAVAFIAQTANAQVEKKGIQCWTDKNGQRMCGDRVPPEYAGQKRDVFKDGRVVDTISATKSAEEKEAEKRRLKEAEERQKAAEYDRALLESYRTPKDITATRDERLSLIDSRMQAAEKNAADSDKSLTGLRTRAEQDEKAGKPVNNKLAKQIKQFEKAQADNNKALERYRHEREALLAKFERDYMRYSELRGLPVTSPPPPKTAAADQANGEKAGETKAAPAAKDAPSAPAAQNAPPKTGS
jgi:hypothetical protein